MAQVNSASGARVRRPLTDCTNTVIPANVGGKYGRRAPQKKSLESHIPAKTHNVKRSDSVSWEKFGENIFPICTSHCSTSELDRSTTAKHSQSNEENTAPPSTNVVKKLLTPVESFTPTNIVTQWFPSVPTIYNDETGTATEKAVRAPKGVATSTSPLRSRDDPSGQPKAKMERKASSQWGKHKTVAKSPKLKCVGKALSPGTLEYKARRDAEKEANRDISDELRAKQRQRLDSWTLQPTVPKSPSVLRRPHHRTSLQPKGDEQCEKPSFTARPMPDFSESKNIEVKQTLKSAALAASRTNKPKKGPRTSRSSLQLKRTVPKPFALHSIDRHEEALYLRKLKIEQEDAELRESRIFRPLPFPEKILDGPTFVTTRSHVPLTEPMDLLPFSQERSERTLAFQEAQRARMKEKAKMEQEAAREREEEEIEQLRREWERIKFRPRPVPKSHYNAKLLANGTRLEDNSVRSIGECASSKDERESITSDNLQDAQTPTARTSLFDEIRNSLSPYLNI